MNRKHFIHLSGASLAALIIRPSFNFRAPVMTLPDHVTLLTPKGMQALKSTDQQKWMIDDLLVTIKQKGNALEVYADAPTTALSEIRLSWDRPINMQAQCLGDHYERSYGDLGWAMPKDNKKLPWYFMQTDDKGTQCFGVKTGANSICSWMLASTGITLVMDTRSGGDGVRLGSRQLHAADIVTTTSENDETPFDTGHRFCGIMCEKPRLPKQPVYGINDWYFAYGNNSYKLIMEHTNLLADLATNHDNLPFSVIDAGWAVYAPGLEGDGGWQDDFSRPNDKFKDMAKLAADIKRSGMRPGLWMRPLCGSYKDSKSRMLPKIPGRDDARNPVLDPTIDENLDRVKNNMKIYRQWGYHLVKHDYSSYDIFGKWGVNMNESLTTPGWRFNKDTHTNAEVVLGLYRAIRESAGDMYLIGCNTMSHLSAGLFELNRIGDDTSGNEWERTRKMGVNTLAFRGIQHNKFYAVDADCVGMTNKVYWSRTRQWLELCGKSGTPLFVSAQPEAIGAAQREAIKDCFTVAAADTVLGRPLDWMETKTPSSWMLNGVKEIFDWS